MLRALTGNILWKLLSVLLAFTLWFFVVGEPELVTSQSAPLLYKSLPRDLEIGSDVPDRVHLDLRGPAGKLTSSNLTETAVVLDLATVQSPGERTFTITEQNIALPVGVSFTRAVPSQLRLRFDRVTSKRVPVNVRISAPQPNGYRIVKQEVDPDRVKIVGAENRLQQIDSAQTDPIDLSAVVGPTEFRVHAYVADAQVRFESLPNVVVRVVVEKIAPR